MYFILDLPFVVNVEGENGGTTGRCKIVNVRGKINEMWLTRSHLGGEYHVTIQID